MDHVSILRGLRTHYVGSGAEYSQIMHGVYTDNVRVSIEHVRIIYGLCMIYVWSRYGLWMDDSWIMY